LLMALVSLVSADPVAWGMVVLPSPERVTNRRLLTRSLVQALAMGQQGHTSWLVWCKMCSTHLRTRSLWRWALTSQTACDP
ncbi:MAG: hypothetical protein K2W33_11720, partial [Burkholderiales bacterium]|nr:hypothetical protein [Burkholderiales bacterium]